MFLPHLSQTSLHSGWLLRHGVQILQEFSLGHLPSFTYADSAHTPSLWDILAVSLSQHSIFLHTAYFYWDYSLGCDFFHLYLHNVHLHICTTNVWAPTIRHYILRDIWDKWWRHVNEPLGYIKFAPWYRPKRRLEIFLFKKKSSALGLRPWDTPRAPFPPITAPLVSR